jgi:hypothetical protein
MATRSYEPITKGGKIQQNLLKAKKMRLDLDDFINTAARKSGVKVHIRPFDEASPYNGMTRMLKNPNGLFLVDIRFNEDQLYFKMPKGVDTLEDGFAHFKNHWILFIQMNEDECPMKYCAPFEVADIPGMMRKNIESCFWISDSESNSNRLNTSIYGSQLSWISINGMNSLFGKTPSLVTALAGLGAR